MSSLLKIVLVHRYYVPDTPPYAHMLAAKAAAFAAAGHDVSVLTCQPSYNRAVVRSAPKTERLDGVLVVRFPVLDDRRSMTLRLVNLVWFSLRLALSRRRFVGADIVMAATTPPILVAWVSSLLAASVRARFIYHKLDIWPEVSGPLGLVGRMLRRVDHATERRAALAVVLSDDMEKTVQHRGRGPVRTKVLNNFDPWPLDSLDNDSASASMTAPVVSTGRASRSGLTIAFAGNLGRFQGLERIAAVIEATADDERIHWHFFGDGALSSTLKQAGGRVTMHGYCPPDEVARFIREEADLGVVSLNPGVIRSAYPSKTMTYLRNGCPLLALIEQDSEIAKMIRDERIGITVSQDEVLAAARALMDLANDASLLRGSATRARKVYESRFDMRRQLVRWRELVEEVAS